MGRVEVKMAVVLQCALQNFLFQFIFVKMRDEVPLSCSLVLPYGVGIVGMVGNELGKTQQLPILSQLVTSYFTIILK